MFKFQGYHLAYISLMIYFMWVCVHMGTHGDQKRMLFLKLELEVIVSTNMTPSARAASASYCELSL